MTEAHPCQWYAQGEENPRHDRSYIERVAELLENHRGEYVHIEAELGGDPWFVNECVELLRRYGWDIVSRSGQPGYCYCGWQRPAKHQRIESACRDHIAVLLFDMMMARMAEECPMLAGRVTE